MGLYAGNIYIYISIYIHLIFHAEGTDLYFSRGQNAPFSDCVLYDTMMYVYEYTVAYRLLDTAVHIVISTKQTASPSNKEI